MKIEEIRQMDWQSLLSGNVTPSSIVEIAIRALIFLIALFIIIRIAGKRSVSQMNAAKLTASVAVSALAGTIIFAPNSSILLAAVILIPLILFQFLFTRSPKSKKSDYQSYPDKVVTLVEDGRLKFETMKRSGITHDTLYTFLRTQGIEHLGQIRRVYWETNGAFSIFCTPTVKPGLSILPDGEKDLVHELAIPEHFACADCGNVMVSEQTPIVRCTRCGQLSWVEAVRELKKAVQPEKSLYQQDLFQRHAF